MNVKTFAPDTEGTLLRYIETTIAFTFLTIWIVIAFQSKYIFNAQGRSIWVRLAWPILLLWKRTKRGESDEELGAGTPMHW